MSNLLDVEISIIKIAAVKELYGQHNSSAREAAGSPGFLPLNHCMASGKLAQLLQASVSFSVTWELY